MSIPDPLTPMFAQQIRTVDCILTLAVASINTDTPTNIVKLCDADPVRGSILPRIWAFPLATNQPTALYLFLQKKNGVIQRLKDAETMAAQSVSAAAAPNETTFNNFTEARPLRLGPGESLWGGLGVAQPGVCLSAEIADFSPLVLP